MTFSSLTNSDIEVLPYCFCVRIGFTDSQNAFLHSGHVLVSSVRFQCIRGHQIPITCQSIWMGSLRLQLFFVGFRLLDNLQLNCFLQFNFIGFEILLTVSWFVELL